MSRVVVLHSSLPLGAPRQCQLPGVVVYIIDEVEPRVYDDDLGKACPRLID